MHSDTHTKHNVIMQVQTLLDCVTMKDKYFIATHSLRILVQSEMFPSEVQQSMPWQMKYCMYFLYAQCSALLYQYHKEIEKCPPCGLFGSYGGALRDQLKLLSSFVCFVLKSMRQNFSLIFFIFNKKNQFKNTFGNPFGNMFRNPLGNPFGSYDPPKFGTPKIQTLKNQDTKDFDPPNMLTHQKIYLPNLQLLKNVYPNFCLNP